MSAHVALPTEAESTFPATHSWRKFGPIGLVVGVVLIGAAFALDGSDHHGDFYFSYLVAWMYAVTLALGAMFFTLIQHAGRAGWSVVVRRTAENMMATLPVLALFFIPVFLGRHELYHHWMDATIVAEDAILKGKAAFLNEGFWTGRSIFYVGTWGFIGWYFRRRSVLQDTMGDDQAALEEFSRGTERRAAVAIPMFALTLTFAGVDWIMSMDPHWYSTMWGVYLFAGAFMAALAFLGIIHILMQRAGLMGRIINDEHYHDLGKLTFAFMVFWTYIAFSQYFLIWYANIPEETSWYAHRMGNSWEYVGITLMLGHFVIPFFFLMPRTIKRVRWTLALGCAWMLVMHYIDLQYMIMPVHAHHGVHPGLTDLLTWVGLFAVFFGAFILNAGRAALVPMKDPRLQESVSFVNI